MVAAKWDLDMAYMLEHFGWKAALAVIASTAIATIAFRKGLGALTRVSRVGHAGGGGDAQAPRPGGPVVGGPGGVPGGGLSYTSI